MEKIYLIYLCKDAYPTVSVCVIEMPRRPCCRAYGIASKQVAASFSVSPLSSPLDLQAKGREFEIEAYS